MLARSAADEDLARRGVVLVLTAMYWRNTWKYQARGFRHLFWDSGTMLANVLAAGNALGAAPRLVIGFVDDEVNHVLGVDPERETALELVGAGPPARGGIRDAAADHARDAPASSSEVDYPLLRDMVQCLEARHTGPRAPMRERARAKPGPEGARTTHAAPPPRTGPDAR